MNMSRHLHFLTENCFQFLWVKIGALTIFVMESCLSNLESSLSGQKRSGTELHKETEYVLDNPEISLKRNYSR